MASNLSKLDLLIVQIDGLHIGNDLVLVAALGIDGNGDKHPLGLVEGATENTAVVQALIDNLIERGLDPVCRLFIIDGAKALSKVIRRTFGAYIHKARNVIERLPKPLHAWSAGRCAKYRHGAPLDGGRHVGSGQGLPPFTGTRWKSAAGAPTLSIHASR
jgi:Transposase, Mutator family